MAAATADHHLHHLLPLHVYHDHVHDDHHHTALAESLASVDSQLSVLTGSVERTLTENAVESEGHIGEAQRALARAVALLREAASHRRNSLPASSAARANGELQALTGLLFAPLAQAEGVALEGSHLCAAALGDLELFYQSRVAPLLQAFSASKESALAVLARAEQRRNDALQAEELALQALHNNRDSIAATSRDLDKVQDSLNAMAYQMEDLAERRRELDAKRSELRERRQASGVCPAPPCCVIAVVWLRG